MKKSLIAIAALATMGAASAQSSLTLYGVADIYVAKSKGASAAAASGGVASSRFGLRGSEDLGGGLKANFNFESAVNLGNGATNPAMFDRQANVGFSGGFGTIKLGRSWTAFDDIHGAANSGFDSALSATNGVIANTVVGAAAPVNTTTVWVGYNAASSAQIYYATPEMGGLSGAVAFNLSGNKAVNDITSFHVKYANGPIYAGLAYQNEKGGGFAGADRKHTLLNASYDLGMAKLLASYRNVKNPLETIRLNSTSDEYQVGADIPVGSNLTVSAGYAVSKTTVTAGSIRNAVGYSVAANYSLSKRTMVYGGFQANKVNGVTGNVMALGVNHSF